ncbi:MAG: Rne/Rng family ribonuclease [Lactobacillaceae bacterium]|nr:Rne/Rng family ribonuclease [Lactobacillaceae bacterium]
MSDDDIDDDDEQDFNFELQRKLLVSRKLFHKSKIQDVIKEGQVVLVQVVKEERGNKGAALTTYLSLAGRYCVLMPNRIKSGGVSRKITNASDRKRLKSILKELPLNSDMSMIVRTAGEDKTKIDITRDYNYLIRTWNQIKTDALKSKAPKLIHEEANLIKRALRDMYTKDISEVIVDGANAYKTAKDFIRILSPQSMKKIKTCRENDAPLFQRFQVEGQLEKLHDTTVQLESGGYLVINPTEALVAIDVNSGRATKEKDLEETALKTNLEAVDEIARQLRLRNLAGLVVVDFIDMEDSSNDNAVEKRMREALKKDRSRVQVGKMSCFGLIEISRQRMHPSFFETSYEVCPHCLGKGMVRTTESCSVSILREIEGEGVKGRYSSINVYVPCNIAIYLLNQKRTVLSALEAKYNMGIIISADDNVKNISNFRIERTKTTKGMEETSAKDYAENNEEAQAHDEDIYWESNAAEQNNNGRNNNFNRHGKNNGRFDKRRNHDRRNDNGYNDRRKSYDNNQEEKRHASKDDKKEKSSWWKKLIGG